jgi:hypothetical protein
MGNEDPLQAFRGLVISNAEVTDLLQALDRWVASPERRQRSPRHAAFDSNCDSEQSGGEVVGPIAQLCRAFGLSAEERRCIVAALAPELDSRYERVFAFLQDDATRKGPSVGLLLDLLDPRDPWKARRLFLPSSPLIRWQLLHIFDRSAGDPSSLLGKGVRLDDRIVEFLLDEEFNHSSGGQREIIGPVPRNIKQWQTIREVLFDCRATAPNSSILFVLSGPAGVGQRALADWLAEEVGSPVFWTDAKSALKEGGNARLVVREAVLRGAALAIDHAEFGLTNESLTESLFGIIGLAREQVPLTFIVCDGPWHTPPR